MRKIALTLFFIAVVAAKSTASGQGDPNAGEQITGCLPRNTGQINDPDNHHPQNWEHSIFVWHDGVVDDLWDHTDGWNQTWYAGRNYLKTRGQRTYGAQHPDWYYHVGTLYADVLGDGDTDWDVTIDLFQYGQIYYSYRVENQCMIRSTYLGLCWRVTPTRTSGYNPLRRNSDYQWLEQVPKTLLPINHNADPTAYCFEYQ
ncbi:MAG: hypothetical protein L0154_04230 [Chloroflexi bacterium]|nr:hypothetical protein [Chloroflexota bacterium]